MKKLWLASTAIISASLFTSAAWSAPCAPNSNGTFTSNNTTNNGGCSIASVAATIGDNSIWNTGFLLYSQNINRTMTIENDLTTTLKGSGGISVYGTAPTAFSTFDASGRTINLTIENLTANASLPIGDNIAKAGVHVSHGGTMTIGSLNLTMLNLPNGNDGSTFGLGQRFEHYGIVVGSTVNAAETSAFNGYQSKAIFDNMNIKMQSTNNGWNVYPLLAGIRVIQGAGGNSGNGSAGYVEVKNDLAIDINATSNDAIGIYISGSEHNGVVPEVHLNNSNIKIKSTSSRANAIRLGKTASIGTGEGRLFSTGHMEIDTLQAACPSSNDLRLFVFLKIGVSGSVWGLI
ncbi:hypothetical protein ACFO1V_09440 [Daeguia caeni]|uniref:Uncharacterized protein n=1 Tax=Daeguia caeni TaxID=439612 RepID=A0ABV9H569_9HYPH